MNQTAAARTPTRRTSWFTAVGLVVLTASFIGWLANRPASSSAPAPTHSNSAAASRAVPSSAPASALTPRDVPRLDGVRAPGRAGGGVTEHDGALPDGVTVFDDEYPGVANLNPDLLHALRRAATDATDAGVEFDMNSGWRSPEFQRQLFREAVSEYGSEEEAARWVATAETSPHVSGDAVDLASGPATEWLQEHGARYGLCQIYGNEPWHYELRPSAVDRGCPPMYADSSHDPRMQR